jgi:2-methylcitrate dehydratase PrpD
MALCKENTPSCLDRLVDMVCRITYSSLPPAVVAKAKECLGDFVAIFCAGTRKEESIRLRNALGESAINNNIEDVALWLGSTARMLDIDDGHRYAMAHPGVVINATAIALASALPDIAGKQMLEAIVRGYEVYCYQGRVINPSAYLKRGVDATCLCGSGASAAVAASMLGLSVAQTADAIALAASLAGGLNQSAIDGSAQKYLVAGWGAKLGLCAARLAQHGLGGPAHVFEGRLGFCNAFSPDPDLEYLNNPQLVWDILNVYIKRYACVRRIHATLDAVKSIVDCNGLTSSQVAQIRVFGSEFLSAAGGRRPRDMAQAQTSVPYSIAIILSYGEVSDELMHENLHNEEIAVLADRVLVSEDAEIILLAEKDSSLWGAARVELLTMDGRNFSETRIYPEGDPECPLPEGEVLHKFMTLMQKPMGETRAEALWRDIQSLDENLRAGTIFHQMLSQL